MNAEKMLTEGDIVELREGQTVYANVPEHFLYSNKKGSFALAKGAVKIGGELSYLAGKYVVYKTAEDGGGASYDGGYPNGHHVFCERFDDRSVRVDFYETGSFTAMICDLVPVGRAVMRWVEE